MKFSLLIATCSFPTVKLCIESILKTTVLDRCDMEVIVSMNGCEPEARQYVESLGKRWRFIWIDKRVGAITALNLAAHISDGEYLIKMDDDVQVLTNGGSNLWVDLLYEPFKLFDDVGQTGPMLEPCFGPYYALLGFLTMTPKKVWNELKGLDPAFNPGFGDDLDYSIRVKRAGYQLLRVPMGAETYYEGKRVLSYPVYHPAKMSYGQNGIPLDNIVYDHLRLLYKRYGAPVHPDAIAKYACFGFTE